MKNEAMVGEFLGTFTLVFTSVCAGSLDAGNLAAALGAGFAVLAMAFTYQKVSGAHFNPALSLAMWCNGKISCADFCRYFAVQTFAATAAGYLLVYFLGLEALKAKATVHLLPQVTLWQGLWMEVLLTFFLVETVFYAVVIGLAKSVAPIVLAALIIVNTLGGSYLTGAAFNPARALGTAIAGSDFQGIWIHVLGPTIGALISSGLIRLRSHFKLLPSDLN